MFVVGDEEVFIEEATRLRYYFTLRRFRTVDMIPRADESRTTRQNVYRYSLYGFAFICPASATSKRRPNYAAQYRIRYCQSE